MPAEEIRGWKTEIIHVGKAKRYLAGGGEVNTWSKKGIPAPGEHDTDTARQIYDFLVSPKFKTHSGMFRFTHSHDGSFTQEVMLVLDRNGRLVEPQPVKATSDQRAVKLVRHIHSQYFARTPQPLVFCVRPEGPEPQNEHMVALVAAIRKANAEWARRR